MFAGHEGAIEVDSEVLPPRLWEGFSSRLWRLEDQRSAQKGSLDDPFWADLTTELETAITEAPSLDEFLEQERAAAAAEEEKNPSGGEQGDAGAPATEGAGADPTATINAPEKVEGPPPIEERTPFAKTKEFVLAAGLLANGATPEVPSFRTPVHKRAFRCRNKLLARFENEFRSEVGDITKSLRTQLEKETVGDQNWNHMVHQLVSGVVV